jgi:hypothetical protein
VAVQKGKNPVATEEFFYLKRAKVEGYLQNGFADEHHWNVYMALIGADRVDRHLKSTQDQNADYLWPERRIIFELKNLEKDLTETEGFARRVVDAADTAGTRTERDQEITSVVRLY